MLMRAMPFDTPRVDDMPRLLAPTPPRVDNAGAGDMPSLRHYDASPLRLRGLIRCRAMMMMLLFRHADMLEAARIALRRLSMPRASWRAYAAAAPCQPC